MISTTITNGGTTDLTYFDWEIEIEGDSPLGEYFGGSPLLMTLFRGRVLRGSFTSGEVRILDSTESMGISSTPAFGIGHVNIVVSVLKDGDVIAEKTEDGSLLGGRIFLHYPEE